MSPLSHERNEQLRATVVALYRDGYSVRQIAERVERSIARVHFLLRDERVEMRPAGGTQRRKTT